LTINNLIKIASRGRLKGFFAPHWNFKTGCLKARDCKSHDALAMAVVNTLYDSFNPKCTVTQQLHTATQDIDEFIDILMDINYAIDKELVKARKCK